VTTQDPTRNRALVVPDKTMRVYNYHRATLHALAELIAASGLSHPQEIQPIHFSHRISGTDVLSFARLYPEARPGELLQGNIENPRFHAWAFAQAESFAPVAAAAPHTAVVTPVAAHR
jgi:hypothetical protein